MAIVSLACLGWGGWVIGDTIRTERIRASAISSSGQTTGRALLADGNGGTAWGVASGLVSSVHGRAGAVTAQTGDYTAAQVAALALAGGQLTGNVTFSGAQTVDGRDLSVDGTKLDGIATAAIATVQTTGGTLSGAGTAGSPLTVADGAISQAKLGTLALLLSDMGWLPVTQSWTLTILQTTVDLTEVVQPDFYPFVHCYVDRERWLQVASLPVAFQYEVIETGGVTQVVLGTAPGIALLVCDYVYEVVP